MSRQYDAWFTANKMHHIDGIYSTYSPEKWLTEAKLLAADMANSYGEKSTWRLVLVVNNAFKAKVKKAAYEYVLFAATYPSLTYKDFKEAKYGNFPANKPY